jgi:serine/threonine-protein kinase ATR
VYIRGCVRRFDAVSLQAVQLFLQRNSSYPDLEPQVITASNSVDSPMNQTADSIDSLHWHATLRRLMSALIVPDELQWKSIGRKDTASYMQRIFDKIQSRWAR